MLIAAGLAIWAFSLQSDLDDQRDQTAQAQQQAQQANDQVSALSDQVDQISQSVSDARDQLSQAGSDAKQQAEQALDGLRSRLGTLKDEVTKAVGKPAAVEESAPGQVKWIYNGRTFNVQDGNKFDSKAIVVFSKSGDRLTVSDVSFE